MQKITEFRDIIWAQFPLFFYMVLAYSLRKSHGALKSSHLVYLTICLIIFVCYHFFYKNKEQISEKLLTFTWALFTYYQVTKLEIIYPVKNIFLNIYEVLNWVNLVLLLAYIFLKDQKLKKKCIFASAGFITLGLVLPPLISTNPWVDVWTISQAATEYLSNGINPYTQTYPDIYNGQYNYEPNLIYWPFGLINMTFSNFIFGDVRYALTIFIVIAAYLVKRFYGILPAIIFLLFPVTAFVIEQAWYEPFLIAPVLLLVDGIKNKKITQAAIALGLTCATKQFMILTALPALLYVIRNYRLKDTIKFSLISFFTASSILSLFFFWDKDVFITNTIFNILNYPPRLDALSWFAHFGKNHNYILPSKLVSSIYLFSIISTSIYLLRKKTVLISDFIFTQVIIYFMVFFFGKQAFCNYYYFISIFILVYLFERKQELSNS